MNKRLKGNLILIGLLLILTLSLVEFSGKKRTFESEISSFVLESLDDNLQYKPLSFEEITEQFLLAQEDISDPLLIVKDSIQNQLNLLTSLSKSSSFKQQLDMALVSHSNLTLDNISDFLSLDIELKRNAKKELIFKPSDADLLYKEENRMHEALASLNSALGSFNLSIYSLDLKNSETVTFLHEFQIIDGPATSNLKGIFEMHRETKTVVSFKEI